MDNKQNRFMAVHYQLYTVENGEKHLEEQTSREHPFEFISGFGISLEALEQRLVEQEKGSTFDFTLEPEEAFGPHDPEGVHELPRTAFEVDGKFDHENIYEGAIIALKDPEQRYFNAKVTNVGPQSVTVDTNHPLAGKTLNFTGLLIENREATEAEITQLIKQLTGDCGCGGCNGGCGDGGCKGGCEGGGNGE